MTHIHKFKCMACGLHFSLYSDYPERKGEDVYCPECGNKGGKIHWCEENGEKAIYQFVPGGAPLVELTFPK